VPTVALRAASGATITFVTQNGQTVADVPPQAQELPHLVLFRNGALTDPGERTLILEVSGIEVPPAGVTVTLEVETQHSDPDLGDDSSTGIPVWRESQWMANTSGVTLTGVTGAFSHTFDERVNSGTETIATPTDYFRYEVAVIEANGPLSNSLYTFSQDYVFLLESQWVAPLPEVQEESAGAAPDELIVYYCDMFPFQKSIHDPATWLPREDVTDYVGAELVPQMEEAFRVETDEWGFPWYDAWTGYRPGEDAERLSVALSDGQTWFHGQAAFRGHAEVSIKVTGGDNARYATLTDGLMSIFFHELFHNLQRNINLHNGGDGDVDGAERAWQFFSEGTAVLASSVGQPAVQFAPTLALRAFMANAHSFVGGNGRVGDLNRSYGRMIPYHGAVYWRFLYEQCGGMKDGLEDSVAGMEVIKRTLTVLYSGEVVDVSAASDLVRKVPEIMDRVLEGSSCPFETYEESLIAFADAIYGLGVDSGRCVEPGKPAGCGFYDPHNLYHEPPLGTITYAGVDQQLSGEIRSSFGMDYVEVMLDPATNGQSLTLEFDGAPGAEAEFSVQLWVLMDSPEGARPRRVPTQIAATETLASVDADGGLAYAIPTIDMTAYNRLSLIITRLDARESSDLIGEYTVVLRPNVDSSPGWCGVPPR
jgi:hypothetical protein